MRDYSEVRHYIDLAISLSPDTTELYRDKANFILESTGDSEEALRVIEEGPEMNVADLPGLNAPPRRRGSREYRQRLLAETPVWFRGDR